MLVTGLPPSVVGIVIAPVVDVETAGDEDDPPPTDALPLATVYVHVIPFTVSVAPKPTSEASNATATNIRFIVCIRHSPSL